MASKTTLVKVLVLVGIAGGAMIYAVRSRAPHTLAIGEDAPDFNLPRLEGDPIALHNFRGQVVLVNFWATWCPPCVEETPSLEKFAQDTDNQGIAVIGVSVDTDEAALRKFVAENHLTFPIARDPERAIAARYGTFQFPETYILDRKGHVAEKIIGPADWHDPRIAKFVQNLTGNSRVSER